MHKQEEIVLQDAFHRFHFRSLCGPLFQQIDPSYYQRVSSFTKIIQYSFHQPKVISMVLCTPIYTISIRHPGYSQDSYSPTWLDTNGFIKQTKYKKLHGPCPAGNTCGLCVSFSSDCIVFGWFKHQLRFSASTCAVSWWLILRFCVSFMLPIFKFGEK